MTNPEPPSTFIDHKGRLVNKAKDHHDASHKSNSTTLAQPLVMVDQPPDKKLDTIRDELRNKYGRDYIWSAEGRLHVANHVLNHGKFYTIMDLGTLDNNAIDFHDPTLKENRTKNETLYEFKQSFSWFINKSIIPKEMNVYDFLNTEAIKDIKWTKNRNKDYLYESIVKYDYKPRLIEKIKTIIRTEIIPDLERLVLAEQEKDKYLNGLQEGKKKIEFSYYESWETGIQFLRINGGVDKQTFSKLQKEANLQYHKPDTEMEERFTGWATTYIEKAWEILIKEGYYRPPRS